jgi:hypothetical protein
MGDAARSNAMGASWDAAFEMTYTAYRHCHETMTALRLANPKRVLARPEIPAA